MKKMNPKVKQAWIDALRSGKYKQGGDYLAQQQDEEIAYCCLGVLCELHRHEHGGSWHMSNDGSTMGYEDERRVQYPPANVKRWAGLDPKAEPRLVEMNDIKSNSFDVIAQYIEDAL